MNLLKRLLLNSLTNHEVLGGGALQANLATEIFYVTDLHQSLHKWAPNSWHCVEKMTNIKNGKIANRHIYV